MLYGSKRQQQDILRQAEQYAESIGAKLIFGAMVGSVSQGFNLADSDYDTRFLYLRKDFPERICIPSQMLEDELVKRYYPKGEVFEWIPFWEATSFLQFLIEPSFKNDFSIGLYNIVGWTFLSPYIWDPYGLQSKIVPLIHKIFRCDYKITYHINLVTLYRKDLEETQGSVKKYLRSVHSAATIEWCLKYHEVPPVDLQTLLYGIGREDIWKESNRILMDARKISREEFDGTMRNDDSPFRIQTDYNALLLEYVDDIVRKASIRLQNSDLCIHQNPECVVNDMYKIIYRSVFQSENLLYNKT